VGRDAAPGPEVLAKAHERFAPLTKVMASPAIPPSDATVLLGTMLDIEPRLAKSGVIMRKAQLDQLLQPGVSGQFDHPPIPPCPSCSIT